MPAQAEALLTARPPHSPAARLLCLLRLLTLAAAGYCAPGDACCGHMGCSARTCRAHAKDVRVQHVWAVGCGWVKVVWLHLPNQGSLAGADQASNLPDQQDKHSRSKDKRVWTGRGGEAAPIQLPHAICSAHPARCLWSLPMPMPRPVPCAPPTPLSHLHALSPPPPCPTPCTSQTGTPCMSGIRQPHLRSGVRVYVPAVDRPWAPMHRHVPPRAVGASSHAA